MLRKSRVVPGNLQLMQKGSGGACTTWGIAIRGTSARDGTRMIIAIYAKVQTDDSKRCVDSRGNTRTGPQKDGHISLRFPFASPSLAPLSAMPGPSAVLGSRPWQRTLRETCPPFCWWRCTILVARAWVRT